MDKMQLHIEELLQQFDGDEDEAILELYFRIQASNNFHERKNLKEEYNYLAGTINEKRKMNVYRIMH